MLSENESTNNPIAASAPSTSDSTSSITTVFSSLLSLSSASFSNTNSNSLQTTDKSLEDEANRLYMSGQFAEAEPVLQSLLASRIANFGPHHIETLKASDWLGSCLATLNKKKDAEELIRSAVQGFKETLGEHCIWTLLSSNHLAVVLRNLGELEEAEEVFNLTLTGLLALTSKESDTLTIAETCYNFGILCIQIQNRRRAAQLFQKAHQGLVQVFGNDHPFTADALYWTERALFQSQTEQEKLFSTEEISNNSNSSTSNIGSHNHSPEDDDEDVVGVVGAASNISNTTDTANLNTTQKTIKSRLLWTSASACEICNKEYSPVLLREHHCRTCLRSICDACSPYKATILDGGVKKRARICVDCDRQGFR